jgi:hypothetical protein
MVCPFCSEEHPVTLDRCPLTGQPLRPPIEALPVPEERARFGALLAEAARLYRRNLFVFLFTGSVAFLPLVGLQIWGALPAQQSPAMQEAMRISTQASREHRKLSREERAELQRTNAPALPDRKAFLLGILLAFAFAGSFLALQLLSQAALVPLVGDRALGGTMGPGRAWLAVGHHPGAVLWTATLATLGTMVGALFCLLPGILAAIGFALAMPVVLLERRSGTDALRRSWRLMRVEWPRVVGMWLVAFGAALVLTGPLMLLLFNLVASDPAAVYGLMSRWSGFALQLAQVMISVLVFPLPVIGTTLVYLHARREQENVPLAELQLQMQRAVVDR